MTHRNILLRFGGPPIKQNSAGLTDRFLVIVHIWDHSECSDMHYTLEPVYQTLTRLSIRIESRETKGSRIRTRSRIRGILSVSLILGLDSEAGIL